jgi:uncharacterized protein YegP (UPF0339 family)
MAAADGERAMTPHRFEVYQDKAGKFRWRLIAANGKRVAASGEAFASRYNAERAIADLLRSLSLVEAAPRAVDVSPEAVPV